MVLQVVFRIICRCEGVGSLDAFLFLLIGRNQGVVIGASWLACDAVGDSDDVLAVLLLGRTQASVARRDKEASGAALVLVMGVTIAVGNVRAASNYGLFDHVQVILASGIGHRSVGVAYDRCVDIALFSQVSSASVDGVEAFLDAHRPVRENLWAPLSTGRKVVLRHIDHGQFAEKGFRSLMFLEGILE